MQFKLQLHVASHHTLKNFDGHAFKSVVFSQILVSVTSIVWWQVYIELAKPSVHH